MREGGLMPEELTRFEDAKEQMMVLGERNRYKDRELALLLANGMRLEEAAIQLEMKRSLAVMIARTPLFVKLVNRLRRERENSVYEEDPDQAVEAEARGNFYTLQQIRDNPTGKDADKLKAAIALHEARPSIRKQKLEEGVIKVVFGNEIVGRLREGLEKMNGSSLPPLETSYQEVEEERKENPMNGGESIEGDGDGWG